MTTKVEYRNQRENTIAKTFEELKAENAHLQDDKKNLLSACKFVYEKLEEGGTFARRRTMKVLAFAIADVDAEWRQG